MALQQTKTLDNGFSGSYWKITLLYLDFLNNIARVTLSLYINQTIADSRPINGIIQSVDYSFTGADFAAFTGTDDARAVAYSKIQTNDSFFTNATNV